MNPNFLQDLSYYSDHRVRAADRWYSHIDENRMVVTVCFDDEETQIPFKWDVCPTCDGKGSHVNPSIDAHGLTADDFAEDPDFAESYFRGHYDQPCNECNGRRVVPVAVNPEDLKQVEEHLRALAYMRAEEMAERRMGA